MRLAAGTRLGHYEIVAFIGKGGMGEVYRARDLSLRREVAVKVLQSSEVDSDSWSRFEREAHSASALNHPNICTVHDLGEADGQPYLVMELVEGMTLRQAIENRTLDSASVVPLAIQIADALEAAHAKNIVHRDVKPGNVMITGRGHVKVLDFGLAKLAVGATSGHTATIEPLTAAGAIVGTPQFLSPEALQGGAVDARSDVWAFGVMLYQMVTGELPFKGATPFAVSSAILRDPAPPLPASVTSGLRRVIDRCLEKAPSSRYQHAGELRAELESLQARPFAATLSTTRRWTWIAGLALAAIVVTGLFVWRSRSQPTVQLLSNGAPASSIQEANEVFELGLNFQRVQNEVERAQALFARALEIDPGFSEARRAHAFVYPLLLLNGYTSDLGTLYKAEEELQQVAREAPDLFSLPATQTIVYLAQGRKELVPAARLAEVGRQYPNHADTAISRFILFMFADDNASAQALADDTLRRQPLLGPVRGLMAELRRTEGDAAGAIRELQKVLDQAPANISAITFLTRAYIDNGEADKARDLLEANRKAFADNYAWRQALGSTLAAQGLRDQALAALDETTLRMASALFMWTLPTAEAYARLGDTERALEWIERAVRNGDERTSWLRRSPAFAAVRETPAFARIVDSVEARRRAR
jgi:serine/threonine protein kinase